QACRRGDEPGRDRVHGPGHRGRVRPGELEPQKIAVRIGAHLELASKPRGGFGWRRYGELHHVPGPEHPCGCDPREAERRADRIADGASVEHGARVVGEREGRPRRVHRETVGAWMYPLLD